MIPCKNNVGFENKATPYQVLDLHIDFPENKETDK